MVAKLFRPPRSGLPLLFVAALCACSASAAKGSAGGSGASEHRPPVQDPTPPSPHQADAAAPEGPSASEVAARSLLNRLFRDAGLRIVNDRIFAKGQVEVTLDGYDPERGIGYEYIASEERGTDLSRQEELELKGESGILVLSDGTLEQVEKRALDFLAAISNSNPESGAAGIRRP